MKMPPQKALIDSDAEPVNGKGPLYSPMMQENASSFLNWITQKRPETAGLYLSMNKVSMGGLSINVGNWGVGLGAYSLMKISLGGVSALVSTPIASLLSLPLFLSIKPALDGSVNAFKKNKQAGQHSLKAFGSMVKRAGLRYKHEMLKNPLDVAAWLTDKAFDVTLKAQKGLEKRGASKLAERLDPLLNRLDTQADSLIGKSHDFKEWQALEAVKLSKLDAINHQTHEALYLDWATILLSVRWRHVDDLFETHITQEKDRRELELEKELSISSDEEVDSDKMRTLILELDAFVQSIEAQKITFYKQQGLHPLEITLKEKMDPQLESYQPFQENSSILFDRTVMTQVQPWYRPAAGLPSLLEIVRQLQRFEPQFSSYSNDIGRLESLQEAQEIQSHLGDLTPAAAKPKSSRRI